MGQKVVTPKVAFDLPRVKPKPADATAVSSSAETFTAVSHKVDTGPEDIKRVAVLPDPVKSGIHSLIVWPNGKTSLGSFSPPIWTGMAVAECCTEVREGTCGCRFHVLYTLNGSEPENRVAKRLIQSHTPHLIHHSFCGPVVFTGPSRKSPTSSSVVITLVASQSVSVDIYERLSEAEYRVLSTEAATAKTTDIDTHSLPLASGDKILPPMAPDVGSPSSSSSSSSSSSFVIAPLPFAEPVSESITLPMGPAVLSCTQKDDPLPSVPATPSPSEVVGTLEETTTPVYPTFSSASSLSSLMDTREDDKPVFKSSSEKASPRGMEKRLTATGADRPPPRFRIYPPSKRTSPSVTLQRM